MDQTKNDPASKDAHLTYKLLFENFRDARKIFRIGKSLNEAQSIKNIVFKSQGDMDDVEATLFIAARLGFLLYWFFDNLNILSKLKVVKKDPKSFFKPSMFFWWLGVTFTIINNLRKLQGLKIKLFKLMEASAKETEKNAENEKKMDALRAQMAGCYRTLVKMFGDAIPSGAGWGLYEMLGFKVGDTAIGLGGLISALVSCYETFNSGAAKK